MDEPHRPAELREDAWQATPPEVRQCIALLVAKLADLEARLNQTSQTSSKPPPSDPPSAPPLPTRTPRGKPKTKGAQPGHPDHQRDLLPMTDVTQVVPIRPTYCPACQCALSDDLTPVEPPRRQQVWEVPLVVPEVTDYQYHTIVCPGCQTWVRAERPDDVPSGAFGPHAVALIALLHGRYRISNRELVDLLRMVWHLCRSAWAVSCSASRCPVPPWHRPRPRCRRRLLTPTIHVHVDETRWREGFRAPWLWVAVGTVATLFLIQAGRGRRQMQTLRGATFGGRVTSDRLRAYNCLPPARRQLCGAHLVRTLRSRVEAAGRWHADAADLLALAEVMLAVWGRFRAGQIDRATLRAMIQSIQHAMGNGWS